MKILVFSDSHGNTEHMEDAIRRERPDRVLHLGDVMRDARQLQSKFPELPMDLVPGNCDGITTYEPTRTLELAGQRILMTHGHVYHVKSGYENAIWAAREAKANILLFGHTHVTYCDYCSGLWVMNPGSCRGWGGASYGVILLEKDDTVCYTVKL